MLGLELNALKSQIETTGSWMNSWNQTWEEPLFKHLVLTSVQWQKIEEKEISLKELTKILEVDFISVSEVGKLAFLHITDPCLVEVIEEMGLKASETSIGDLGRGIYVVQQGDFEGIENLKDYVLEHGDDRLLIVEGYYEGPYTRCVWGYGHEEYSVLKSDMISPKGLSLTEIETDDFFESY